MNAELSAKLLKAFDNCLNCGGKIIRENITVEENAFKIKCKCGWRLRGTETIVPVRVKAEADIDSVKTCGNCKKQLPATNQYFALSKKGLYGLRSICKECDRAYRNDNREKKNEYNRKYREKINNK